MLIVSWGAGFSESKIEMNSSHPVDRKKIKIKRMYLCRMDGKILFSISK